MLRSYHAFYVMHLIKVSLHRRMHRVNLRGALLTSLLGLFLLDLLLGSIMFNFMIVDGNGGILLNSIYFNYLANYSAI